MAFSASTALTADELHGRTSRDAFMGVQYTSKAELIQGLKNHPKTLEAMAKCFGTSPSGLLQFIRDDVHLGRLQITRSHASWGLHQGRVYPTNVRYGAGAPAWVTENGTPLNYWRCSNPMMSYLPTVGSRQARMVTPPAPPTPVVIEPPTPPVVVDTNSPKLGPFWCGLHVE